MSRITRVGFWVASLSLLGATGIVVSDARGQASLPPDVESGLKLIQATMSPVTLSWSQRFEPSDGTAEGTLTRLGAAEATAADFFATSEHKLKIQDASVYYVYSKPTAGEGTLAFELSLHNGISYIGQHVGPGKNDIPSLVKTSATQIDRAQPLVVAQESKYLEAAGFAFAGVRAQSAPPGIQPGILSLMSRMGTLRECTMSTVDGRPQFSIEIESPNIEYFEAEKIDIAAVREEYKQTNDPPHIKELLIQRIVDRKALPKTLNTTFIVDPARGYAVTAWRESYPDSRLRRECRCSSFVALDESAFHLPTQCVVEYYEYHTRPGHTESSPVVREVFFDITVSRDAIPQEQFILDYTFPGTRVRDETLPEAAGLAGGAVFYTVPAKVKDLDKVIDEARRGNKLGLGGQGNRGNASVLLLVNVVVLGSLGFAFLVQRIRNKGVRQ